MDESGDRRGASGVVQDVFGVVSGDFLVSFGAASGASAAEPVLFAGLVVGPDGFEAAAVEQAGSADGWDCGRSSCRCHEFPMHHCCSGKRCLFYRHKRCSDV